LYSSVGLGGAFRDGRSTVATVGMVAQPWVLDVPRRGRSALPPSETAEVVDDPSAMTRGVLVGLAISMLLWPGLFWLVTSLLAMLSAA
jgi:hypothetical protein